MVTRLAAFSLALAMIAASAYGDNKNVSPDTISMHRHWTQKMASWQNKVDSLKEQNRRLIEENSSLQQQAHEHNMRLQYLNEQNNELKMDIDYLRTQNEELRGRSNYLERSVVNNQVVNP